MRSDDRSIVFFHRPGFGLQQAEEALRKSTLTVVREGESLTVSWEKEGPQLFIRLVQGDDVRKDAAKIGRATLYAGLMKECDSGLVITFQDLDEVLDEMNTLIEVQRILRTATDGVVSRTWNDELSGPE
jgi:hypothetical protein